MLDQLMQRHAQAAAAGVGKARHALVSAVDPVNHAVKVTLQPEGTESGWMPDPGLAASGLRIAAPCEIGTQVLVESVEGDAEHPVIVGRLFDTTMTPPVSPVTGQPAQPGELLVLAGQATASGQAAATNPAYLHIQPQGFFAGVGTTTSVAITADQIVFTIGGMTWTMTTSGVQQTGGGITSTGDVIANGTSLEQHTHGYLPGSGGLTQTTKGQG